MALPLLRLPKTRFLTLYGSNTSSVVLTRQDSDEISQVEADQSGIQIAEGKTAFFEQYIYMYRIIDGQQRPDRSLVIA